MKVLFIAPIPPPITGHSLVSKVFYDDLISNTEVELVNLSKGGSDAGLGFIRRLKEVFFILNQVRKRKKGTDKIYFTISESAFGNFKDILVYILCFGQLSNMFIHLHGGSIKRLLWDKYSFIYRVNQFFIRRLGGAFISGESHRQIFEKLLDETQIHIVPNFALANMFCSDQQIEQKFLNSEPLKILYMSGMKRMKGYEELILAINELNPSFRELIQVDFAGAFEFDKDKVEFEKRLEHCPNVTYHGIVNDERKQKLFQNAHVFCLPTMFLEGQPISILEAYASGCIVLTTGQSGILDIFSPDFNGFEIDQKSIRDSIKTHLLRLINMSLSDKKKIAFHNANIARRQYRVKTYNMSLRKVMSLSSNNN